MFKLLLIDINKNRKALKCDCSHFKAYNYIEYKLYDMDLAY